jgi:hypothetical protein
MNPDERDEELLQEYLAGDSALSRLYRRGAGEQPGAELDARIRGEARRALEPKGRVIHGPFSRHWIVPTSLAAVVVLSVSIVLLMPAPVSKPGVAGIEADKAAGGARSDLGDAQPEQSSEQRPAAAARAPAAAEIEQRREQAFGARQSNAPADSAGATSGGTSAAPQPAREALEAPGTRYETEATPGKKIGGDDAGRPGLTGAAGASGAPALLESSVAREPRPMPAASVRDDPRAWLSFIEKLLEEHDQSGAGSNLRAFRARYPDFPLPAPVAELAASLDAERP